MSFRVQKLETRIVDHRLRADRVIVSHAGRHDSSRFLIVTAHGNGGARGYGEAATTPLWSGETAETARCAIEHLFMPRLAGHAFDHPREALALMEQSAYGNAFAKSAIDTALWDLWAREQGVPAVKLFADRAPLLSIPTRASVGAYGVTETVRLAVDFWNAGIRTLKFKIGLAAFNDAARLSAVRERLGNAPVFTVDANGAYTTLDAAVSAIEALLPYDVALVEQPVPRERLSLLAQVRKRVKAPIMVDEGVFSPPQLAEALDLDAFDILSIYPGKNGGITHAIDMAGTAQRAGKTCAIGCNLETDLGQAAMAAVAAGLAVFPVDKLACDLPAAIFYESSSVRQPLRFENGRVQVPSGNGFGVEPLE